MLFIKLVSDYLSESSRLVFGKFSGNLKINGKPWKYDFGLKYFFQRIVEELSKNVWNIFVVAIRKLFIKQIARVVP